MSFWQDFLLPASFRGVPFSVLGSEVKAGRKTSTHDYPFRDQVWVEDLGKKGRQYSFRGFLVGDTCYLQEIAMLAAIEQPGTGLLIHPTLGAKTVSIVEFASGQDAERGRTVSLSFTFTEGGSPLFPSLNISTGFGVLSASQAADLSAAVDFAAKALPYITIASAVGQAAVNIVSGFGGQAVGASGDAGLLTNAVAGLPPPAGTTYGRYASGSLAVPQAGASTPAQVIAAAVTARTALTVAVAGAVGVAASAPVNLPSKVQAVTEALRTVAVDPDDQVRLLSPLAGYMPPGGSPGAPIGAAVQSVQASTAALARRAALTSLARASAAYNPASYNEALALRTSVTTLFDAEILVAADAGDVNTYAALRALRSAIILDLNTRAATLPTLIEVTTQVPMPALALAYMLYGDAGRADDVTARANPISPLFMPTDMVLLSA